MGGSIDSNRSMVRITHFLFVSPCSIDTICGFQHLPLTFRSYALPVNNAGFIAEALYA